VDTADTDKQGRMVKLAPPSEGWRNFFSNVFNICNALTLSGTTVQRPSVGLWTGRIFWDSTLQIPVYYAGGGVWKNSAGAPV
ncbi:MAG TPA: hypothetical protein VK663_01135, partial [Burkholderiales bacterium]|nr:hypothetical protein [Burkholderiales bacterium]